jgi:hypothetical protein
MTLVWRPGFSGLTDADAIAYVSAVETADGQPLEFGVAKAINDFVVGCKLDGIWSAIKASCILAGARTLAGALVPLAGTAPNRFGTEGGWNYNRKTGLQGNGTDNYLNSNRNNNADPQNNFHAVVYATLGTLSTSVYLGAGPTTNEVGATNFGYATGVFSRARNGSTEAVLVTTATALVGVSRSSSSEYTRRANSISQVVTSTSQTPYNGNLMIFSTTSGNFATSSRLAFYSIGESIDLTKLDTRVSALITAFGAAIP